MTDIKVYGLLVVDGDVDNGTPGTANMGKAYDDLLQLEQENGNMIDSLAEAWGEAAEAAQAVGIHQSILDIVRDQRNEARGVAGALYLLAGAALKAFNREPYGNSPEVIEARAELFEILETVPEWMRKLDQV